MHKSLQRKLTYLGAIVLLFIPVIYLGLPAAPSTDPRQSSEGGTLAQLRKKYQLGETSLGNVDPAGATMNLVLLGMRGVATSVLWKQADEQKEVKNWPALRSTTDSIILLQPHFLKVWEFHGWNLAYNVSAEWDAVGDRFYWVKEGIKFCMRGVEQNRQFPELAYHTGSIIHKKMGTSDEKKSFRRFYRDQDPDAEAFPNGPDPAVKMKGSDLRSDSYQEARKWYQFSININDTFGNEQHIMSRPLFRANPTKALIDYAIAQQEDGIFDEHNREVWREAFTEWTRKYGKETFPTTEVDQPLHLELEPSEEAEYRKTPKGNLMIHWIAAYQDMCNYRYWRLRCLAEQDPLTVDAHREFYNGRESYFKAQHSLAAKQFYSGMEKFEAMINKYPGMLTDDSTLDEGMTAQYFWRRILNLEHAQLPERYPLQRMWEDYPGAQSKGRENFARYGRERMLEKSLLNRKTRR